MVHIHCTVMIHTLRGDAGKELFDVCNFRPNLNHKPMIANTQIHFMTILEPDLPFHSFVSCCQKTKQRSVTLNTMNAEVQIDEPLATLTACKNLQKPVSKSSRIKVILGDGNSIQAVPKPMTASARRRPTPPA